RVTDVAKLDQLFDLIQNINQRLDTAEGLRGPPTRAAPVSSSLSRIRPDPPQANEDRDVQASTNSAPEAPVGADQLGAIAVDSHHDQALVHKHLEDVERRQQALELRRPLAPCEEGTEIRGNHLLPP